MAANTTALKALYEAVNGKEGKDKVPDKKHETPLDESSLPEAASGIVQQVSWMAKGHVGGDESKPPKSLDEGSVPEATGGMTRQSDYMAKGMGMKA